MKVIFGCVLLLFSSFSLCAQEAESKSYIEVLGEASLSVNPDYATIVLGISEQALTAEEAYEGLSSQMSTLLSYLRKDGDVDELQTEYLNLTGNQNYNEEKAKSYTARQNISFKLQNLAHYDELMLELFALGVNNLQSIQFGSSQEEAIRKNLLAQAVLKAREKALRMTSELGQEIGEAIYISDHLNHSGGPQPMFEARMQSSGPSVQPGQINISVIALVHFRLQ